MPTEVTTTNTEEKIMNTAADAVLENVNDSNSIGGIIFGAGVTLTIIAIGVIGKKMYDSRKAKKANDKKEASEPATEDRNDDDEDYYEE